MPLPQKIIDELSQEPARTPGWSGQLLMFAGTIFFISLFVYAGLAFGYRPYLNAQVRKLDSQIQAFSQKIPLEEQVQIVNFYSQLVNLRSLLQGHITISAFLDWLEKNTQSNTYFTKLTLNTDRNQALLSGVSKTLDDATAQLQILEAQPGVTRLTLNTIALGAGSVWQFDLTLSLTPALFKQSGTGAQ